jgi:hypothetical protein
MLGPYTRPLLYWRVDSQMVTTDCRTETNEGDKEDSEAVQCVI